MKWLWNLLLIYNSWHNYVLESRKNTSPPTITKSGIATGDISFASENRSSLMDFWMFKDRRSELYYYCLDRTRQSLVPDHPATQLGLLTDKITILVHLLKNSHKMFSQIASTSTRRCLWETPFVIFVYTQSWWSALCNGIMNSTCSVFRRFVTKVVPPI